jgi:hypothetical protein
MPEFIPSSMVLQWAHSAGTISLHGDYRTFTYTPSADLVETTAGTDTNKGYLASQKDGKASIAWLDQAGTLSNIGMNEGAIGTLIWGPEGSGTSKPKYSMPAISGGLARSYGYNALSEYSCDFQQNGARTDGTY